MASLIATMPYDGKTHVLFSQDVNFNIKEFVGKGQSGNRHLDFYSAATPEVKLFTVALTAAEFNEFKCLLTLGDD